MALEERRRVDGEHLKARKTLHAVQMQIDSISAMHVDTLIVDTMRAYNINASRLRCGAYGANLSARGRAIGPPERADGDAGGHLERDAADGHVSILKLKEQGLNRVIKETTSFRRH